MKKNAPDLACEKLPRGEIQCELPACEEVARNLVVFQGTSLRVCRRHWADVLNALLEAK